MARQQTGYTLLFNFVYLAWSSTVAIITILLIKKMFPEDKPCHSGWIYHGGSCYLFVKQSETWSEAMGHCKALGGLLAEVQGGDENTFLQTTLLQQYEHNPKKASVRYWLGGTDIAVEGQWGWVSSGKEFEYTHWHPGQPDNYKSNEHCLEMTGDLEFDWNDMDCTLQYYFICKRE